MNRTPYTQQTTHFPDRHADVAVLTPAPRVRQPVPAGRWRGKLTDLVADVRADAK